MSDLQQLLEAKRKDWTTPSTELAQPSQETHQVEVTQPAPTRPQTIAKSSPPKQDSHLSERKDNNSSVDRSNHIDELLAELEALPPHNSKLTKFIMRLEPSLGKRLKDFCDEGNQKLTPEMLLEAVLLILEGDSSVDKILAQEHDPELDELVSEKRDALRKLIVTVAGQRAERRSRAGVVRRTLSMAGVKLPN